MDGITRVGLAIFVAAGLGFALLNVRRVPRDLALTGYALAVAILGIFAVLGTQAAAIGGGDWRRHYPGNLRDRRSHLWLAGAGRPLRGQCSPRKK